MGGRKGRSACLLMSEPREGREEHTERRQECLRWPRFTLINGIRSLDPAFLRSLGVVSSLLLTDPFNCCLLLSHCSSCCLGHLRFCGEARRNQSANLISADETGRNRSAEKRFLERARQKAAPPSITLRKNGSNVDTCTFFSHRSLERLVD